MLLQDDRGGLKEGGKLDDLSDVKVLCIYTMEIEAVAPAETCDASKNPPATRV